MDFKDLIAYIQKVLDTFFGVLPQIQKQTLESVLNRTQQLELSGDRIRISVENLKRLAEVQSSLRKILLSDNYMKAVSSYAKAYNEVTKLQQSYFQTIEANYGGPALAKEMMKIAKENVVSQLTETGLMANVADPVKDVIRRAITSGSSYATLQEQLNDVLAGEEGGILERYTKQISTDAINQYSRQYSQLASADLGLEWFRYAGSNIKTSRPFCLACTDRKYFHISEIPALLRGDFPEFKKHDGKIYERTKLPQGMYPETDVANFPTLLGGYNCGHQYRPISDKRIPADIKQRVYESAEYKAWKGMDAVKDTGAVPGKEKKVSGAMEIKDLDIKGSSLKLDVTGGLATALGDLLSRGRKIITNYEKMQLINLNELKRKKTLKNGGSLYATEKQKILPDELKTIDKLLSLGRDVLFMPDSYFGKGKKFDVLVFKENSYFTADLKYLRSKNPETIGQAVSYGATQGKNIIVDANSSIDYAALTDGLIRAATQNESLKTVVLFYKSRAKTYNRNQILSRKFKSELYKDFVKN